MKHSWRNLEDLVLDLSSPGGAGITTGISFRACVAQRNQLGHWPQLGRHLPSLKLFVIRLCSKNNPYISLHKCVKCRKMSRLVLQGLMPRNCRIRSWSEDQALFRRSCAYVAQSDACCPTLTAGYSAWEILPCLSFDVWSVNLPMLKHWLLGACGFLLLQFLCTHQILPLQVKETLLFAASLYQGSFWTVFGSVDLPHLPKMWVSQVARPWVHDTPTPGTSDRKFHGALQGCFLSVDFCLLIEIQVQH